MGLNAMEELKVQSKSIATIFFEVIRSKLAEGTLTNAIVRDELENITIESKGHPVLIDKDFGEDLAGPDGEALFKYLKAVRAKVEAREALSQTEKEQAKAIYQLIMAKQELPETARFRREFHPDFIRALK